MNNYLIIADDFTGANDTGVQLTKRGIETQVVLDGENIVGDNISYVLDTESRGLNSGDAYDRLKRQLNNMFSRKFDLVYKKIDSTLRGNITAELIAVDEEYKPDLIIFAPAFPDIGRITKDSIHYVKGIRITETEFSKDPQNPVLEDNIQKILESKYSEAILHHNLEEIRKSNIGFNNSRVHTFDAENNQDLEKIVTAAINTNKKILWVGSAGLANVILQVQRPLKPVLAIVGSLSEVSRNQIKYAEGKGVNILKVNIGNILKEKNKDYYVKVAREVLYEGKDLIITSSYDLDNYKSSVEVGKELSMTKEEVSYYTQKILGEIGKEALSEIDMAGLFITGGDTAMGFIRSTKAKGSRIVEEIITGIPLMKLNGGEFDGLKVVTKAGAFGSEDALYYAMSKLKEEK